MASVYKALSKSKGPKSEADEDGAANGTNGARKNKQRVLILSSRGVTYRYATLRLPLVLYLLLIKTRAYAGTDIFSMILRRCYHTAGKMLSLTPSRKFTSSMSWRSFITATISCFSRPGKERICIFGSVKSRTGRLSRCMRRTVSGRSWIREGQERH